MKSTFCVALFALLAIIPVSGCSDDTIAEGPPAKPDPVGVTSDRQFHEQLLKIGREYLTFTLIDPAANIAPTLCAAMPGPPSARLSQSDDTGTHGRKLYFLFAAKPWDYTGLGSSEEEGSAKPATSPTGQVLVKESWQAEPSDPPGTNAWVRHQSGTEVHPFVYHNEKHYTLGEKKALFVMMKLAPDTPGTDRGWVYATLTADGSKVTSAGKLQSCMECHVTAPHDRLFGLPGERLSQRSHRGNLPAGDFPRGDGSKGEVELLGDPFAP